MGDDVGRARAGRPGRGQRRWEPGAPGLEGGERWPRRGRARAPTGAPLYLERGGSAQLHASWASAVEAGQRGVIGTKGAVVVEGQSIWELSRLRQRSDDSRAEHVVDLRGPIAADMAYRAMARHFVDCIRRDVASAPTVRDGLAALEVSLAILRSAEARRVVPIAPATI